MGLDMYLKAKIYASGYEHNGSEEQEKYKSIVEAVGLEGIASDHSPFVEVEVTIAYWRKANAIHHWFVHNVQNGEDNCGTYYVTKAQLQELLDLCHKTIKVWRSNKDARVDIMATLLPTVGGFFFGSTDYGDGYCDDLKSTIAQVSKILAHQGTEETLSVYYHSSW
jgi:hypothetical protein